jgi:hypothetical protein
VNYQHPLRGISGSEPLALPSQLGQPEILGTGAGIERETVLNRLRRQRCAALFGEDGLQVRPVGPSFGSSVDRELPWSQLSSGEQIWARLVATLLVLRSSTALPFAWLDDPLEHLDPSARRIVASDKASATSSGRPARLIITTYEHTLARRLAEDLPGTHLRSLTASSSSTCPRDAAQHCHLATDPVSPPDPSNTFITGVITHISSNPDGQRSHQIVPGRTKKACCLGIGTNWRS